MRFRTIKTRGFGYSDLDIDLDRYGDARVIAICGPIGAGKSTALELWGPGAFYRKTPTRGSLANLARTRDAFLEVGVVNGQPWTIRHLVDGVNGKAEAVVLDGSGAAVLPDSKVRSFDAWAAKHLPDPDVLLMTNFTPQGSGGFAALSRAERMAVIGRVVADIEGLEARAEQARERVRTCQAEVATLEARLADARGTDDLAAVEAQHRAALVDQADAQQTLEAARSAVRVAQAEAIRVAELRAAYEAAAAEQDRIARRTTELRSQELDLERRLQNNRAVLEHAAEIRAAVAELEPARAALAVAEREETEARSRAAEAEGTLARLAEQRSAAHSAAILASARLEAAQRRFQDAEAVRAAVAALPSLRAAVTEQEASVALCEEALAVVSAEQLAGAEQRIDGLREGLATIALDATDAMRVADATLVADDEIVAAAASWPGRLADARNGLQAAKVRLAEAVGLASKAAALAARAADVEAAGADVETWRNEMGAERERLAALDAQRAAADRELQDLYDAIRDAEGRTRLARERVEALAKTAAREGPLAGAEARLAEIEPQLAAVRAELASLDSATPAPALPPPAPDVAALERAVTAAEATVRERDGLVSHWAQRAADARAAAARVAALKADLAVAHAELADWKRLADDLGRDGLQALEIDAGGPELSAIASDLLHAAYGPRWTVSLDTTRASSDGKRVLEDCEINVIDTARGREGPLESFSGGERVILGEAVSLALTTIACRNAGIESPTLVRDESGAALDEAAGRAYVAMLRRAADLIGADRVLFVSHSPAMQELADARIEIGGAA